MEDYVAEIILRSNAQIFYTDYGLQEIRMRQKRERKEQQDTGREKQQKKKDEDQPKER